METKVAAVSMRGVTKTFGAVIANEDVDLDIYKGEILALLGENGSGKTTLMNMLSGIYFPDQGQIMINGQNVVIASPKDALNLGIGMVHQHFKLVDVLSATENIILGLEGKLNIKEAAKKIENICNKYGFEVDPKQKIYDMTVSQKQTVEIVKVLYRGADILILDEPTAVLTPQETEKLFRVLRKMRDDGKAIVIITHKMHEVKSLSDRVAVLRGGRYIGSLVTKDTDVNTMTDMMVGHAVQLNIERPDPVDPKPRIEVEGLTIRNEEGIVKLKDVSFTANSGEILGIAGISGCGQKELLEAIAGLQPIESGTINYIEPDGSKEMLIGKDPLKIAEMGVSLSFVPEDRLGMGLVGNMDLTDNMMLRSFRKGKTPFVNRKPSRKLAESVVKDLAVVTPGITTPVRRLSGGNVQKVLLGREIASSPTVLLTAYAVRGLDINSSYTIYDLLNEQKKKGVAVIFVGEDLDVLVELSDRIMVLCGGQVSGIVDARTTDKNEVGIMNDKKKEPLFHIVKRDALPWYQSVGIRAIAIVLALIVCAVVTMILTGTNPIQVFQSIIAGAFGSARKTWITFQNIAILLLISLALTPAFKMKFWNIGGEGQVLIGGLASAACMICLAEKLPAALVVVCMIVTSIAAGAFWAFIPAFFKAKWNTNETLYTLMMNYIATQLVAFFTIVWEVPKGSGKIGIINQNSNVGWLPQAFGSKYLLSILVAVLITVFMYIYLKYSKHGYEISVVGESENTAKYVGIKVEKVIMRTMALSGAVCGLVGLLLVGGINHTITTTIAGGQGFTAVMVSWMSKFNPLTMVFSSFLIIFMNRGASEISTNFGLNQSFSDILTGIILFFIIGCEFFIAYQLQSRKKAAKEVQ